MNDDIKNELASLIQKGFPTTQRPYLELAKQLKVNEDEVFTTIQNWKDAGKLREISAVMEGAAIGYDSALVCAKVPKNRLKEVADIISAHPTVTHNYERNYEYNIWFTIAVPFSVGLENHLDSLCHLTGIDKMHALRRTTTFKVGVAFDFKKGVNQTDQIALPKKIETVDLDDKSIQILRILQTDLPVTARPFQKLAEKNGLQESDLLNFISNQKGKALRRYIGTFRHRKMGISSNGMTVWNIKSADLLEKGMILASAKEVSHCYARNSFPGFDYTLYTMLHAPNKEKLFDIADDLSKQINCEEYLILESPTEFKKTRLKYFLPELDSWWKQFKLKKTG